MNTTKHLERAALAAHRAGQTWAEFWQQHGREVAAAEPWNVGRYHRLVNKLLSLVASGDREQRPIPVGLLWGEQSPWDEDDAEADGLPPRPIGSPAAG